MDTLKQPAPKLSGPQVAPATSVVAEDAQPGALRGQATIVLHTRHAQRLYLGRQAGVDDSGKPVPAIPGVLRFASQVRQVAVGARAGDPYADWMLVRIESEYDVVMQAYEGLQEQVDDLLKSRPGINIEVALSVRPLEVPMQFGSPYAFLAADIVATFDGVARGILTAVHTSRVTRAAGSRQLEDAKRHARRFLLAPSRYVFSGATREDLLAGNQRATSAMARLGKLPDEIFHRHVRPRYERLDGGDQAASLLDDDADDGEAGEIAAAAE